MSITLSALQKQRRDTAANWTAENPTLLAGEIGLESDTGYWKVGDGTTAWTSLAYVSGLGAEIPVNRLADGSARQLLQTAANGTDVEWTSNVDVPGTLDVTGAATFDNNVIIQGDLTVNGTETIINTQTLDVEDKNIVIGKVATPSDVTADGGGITLKGTTDKTINWVDATDAWTFSEHVNLASGKAYYINNTQVLSGSALGSGVTSSSLTSVGTIGTGVWQGTTVATGYGGTGIAGSYSNGQLLIGKTDGTLAKATLTASTGVTITNGDGAITISATGSGGTVTSVTASSPLASTGGNTPDISIQDASTTQKGAVQLEDSTSSTSTTKAATPNSVKTAYDLANAALPKSGGTVTGNLEIGTAGSLTFEGATADGFETTLAVVDPTADRTITLPDVTGTVITTGDTGSVTSTMIADGTIVNGDVNASAAIAGTKISPDFGSQNITTTGTVSDGQGSLRTLPQNSQTSSYTLIASDTGKHISITTGGVTVPASVFNVGDVVTIFNNSGSNQTITQGSSTTVRLASTANTGNRTLAQYGVATVLCVSSNTFVISGTGLT
jgi:hypothetical protein